MTKIEKDTFRAKKRDWAENFVPMCKLSECRKNVYIWQEMKDMRYVLLMDDLTKYGNVPRERNFAK